ncbi:ATP-binding cassette sub-family G member 4 [Thrips palmi]|uniref:ATP-binding cassette sub-family G member 4 n=1 Tax=Thrips palmi TaxID=161013 RepID=A0A6P8ZZ75_THRPL|nr:ATP-binding cassette sub-family G member 4 [Thrips palmi]
MDVGFHNLSYTPQSWKLRGDKPVILKDVSGRFKSGELSAILGPSGAGKSTLLNALSGLTTRGVEGSLTVNGRQRNPRTFNKCSRYITQEDLLQPLLTVHELMMVSASLKLPSNTSHQERIRVVSDVLDKLGLLHAAATRTERLSGGEKKRLSIALELVNNPPVFFLDEPTSGLDNVSTGQCLRLLRRLAHEGPRTFVLTIHQPSASLFELFDHVYVLARGRCVFQGPPGQLVPFLARSHIACPRHYNPADFLMELTDSDAEFVQILSESVDNGKLTRTPQGSMLEVDKGECLSECSGSSQGEAVDAEPEAPLHATPGRRHGSSQDDMQFPTSCWLQFAVLLRRMLLQICRNKVALQIQFMHHSMCAFMVAVLYFNVARDGSQFFTHMKFSIGLVLFYTYTHVMVPVLVYPYDVKLFKKEHFNRWYGLNAYYVALSVAKMPLQFVLSSYFLAIIYYSSGLPMELDRFLIMVLTGILISLVAEGFGHSIGAVFSVTNGSAVGPMLIAPFMGLAVYGFDFAQQIPWYITALMKTSFLRSGVAAFVLTMFGFDRQMLDCNEYYCHFQNPKKVLRFLDVEGQSAWSEIVNLVILAAFYRLTFWCGLRWRAST